MKTNNSWLELARDYVEALYELDRISNEEYAWLMADYDRRLR